MGEQRRLCECGCGHELPPYRGTGTTPRFATDACRQRSYRAVQARREAIAIWDALQILDERPVLAALAALSAASRADLLENLDGPLSACRDRTVSRLPEAS